MESVKKIICASFVLLSLPLVACNPTTEEKSSSSSQSTIPEPAILFKLDIQDFNDIILNKDELFSEENYGGLYKQGTKISFEIQFFSGVKASLLINGQEFTPTYPEDNESGYIDYIVPFGNVEVVSLVNGKIGDEIIASELYKLNIIDTHDFIYDKPEDEISYFASGAEIVLHSRPITDVDLAMYVDDVFYTKQTSVETSDGFVWEYRYTMPAKETTIEFKIAE